MECAGILLDRAAREKVIHLADHAGGSSASLSTLLGSFSIPDRNGLGDVTRTDRFKVSIWVPGVMNSIVTHATGGAGECCVQKETFPYLPTSKAWISSSL